MLFDSDERILNGIRNPLRMMIVKQVALSMLSVLPEMRTR
jgi:hypothetical protein